MQTELRQRKEIRSPLRLTRLLQATALAFSITGMTVDCAAAQDVAAQPACVLQAFDAKRGRVSSVHLLMDGSALLQAVRQQELTYIHEWWRFDPATREITPAGVVSTDVPAGSGARSLPLPRGALLLQGTGDLLLRYNPSSQRVDRLPIGGIIDQVFELPDDGSALLISGATIHRYAVDGRVSTFRLPGTNAILGAGQLPSKRGVFINTDGGVFRFDGDLKRIIDGPTAIEDLPEGLLISERQGVVPL